VIPLLLALIVAMLLAWWLASARSPLAILDHPNERSLHARPVPRSGGIAILMGIAAGWGWLLAAHGMPAHLIWVIGAAMAVAAVSLLDDLFELPARVRLPVHMLAAVLVLLGGLALPWGWPGWIISLFGIVWMLNLFNFMDGMDGFAGGMAMAGFGFLGAAGWLAGSESYALYCAVVSIAALGFLLFNFPPARIFMGDVGSATLGLLAAALSLWGDKLHIYPAWFPLLVFSPFIVDATVTLARRGLRGERVWQAHREHYYQRLVQAGWGHRKTVLVEYALMISAGGSGIWALAHPGWSPVLQTGWAVAYVVLMLLAERRCGPVIGNDAGGDRS